MEKICEIHAWKGKHLDDLSLNDLSELNYILEQLPVDIDVDIVVGDCPYDSLETYIEERREDFFNVTDEDYKKIVGTCFINGRKNVALKVVGLRDDYDHPYYKSDGHMHEFLYEQYEKYDDTWHNKDYIWLQETAKGAYAEQNKEYLKWCIDSQTEMNIGSEEMYHLGKDGNLYVDITCGGDYIVFTPMSAATFEVIKAEAIENDGEYKVEKEE